MFSTRCNENWVIFAVVDIVRRVCAASVHEHWDAVCQHERGPERALPAWAAGGKRGPAHRARHAARVQHVRPRVRLLAPLARGPLPHSRRASTQPEGPHRTRGPRLAPAMGTEPRRGIAHHEVLDSTHSSFHETPDSYLNICYLMIFSHSCDSLDFSMNRY